MELNGKFIFIAGPCVIENAQRTIEIAAYLKKITSQYPLTFIFKASFDKANRTSLGSFRGPGLNKGMAILSEVKRKVKVPILSDVHCCSQIGKVKDILDVIQIPAFLCRQTDLIIEAAKTKKWINVKKGQFLSPFDIRYIIEKILSCANKRIIISERGSCFGYNNLVVDFRAFPVMQQFGYPVIYDVTHSLQRPSAQQGVSGGDNEFVKPLALSATACGVDGIFMEVHPSPKSALSDKYTSYPLAALPDLLKKMMKVREAIYG